jgi:hypothetical protein
MCLVTEWKAVKTYDNELSFIWKEVIRVLTMEYPS